MGFWEKLNGKISTESSNVEFIQTPRSDFNKEEFDEFCREKMAFFCNMYDLCSVQGIRAIPVSESKRYPDGGRSPSYMPEQILNKKATEYKKSGKYILATECLLKANELYSGSYYIYQREDYERAVDMLVLASQFDEAKKLHKELDSIIGTRINELKHLKDVSVGDKKLYQKKIIDPFIEEYADREHYYWLLENLSELAPNSFGGYRRMKKGNTENYNKIIELVKKRGLKISTLKFWYS